MSHREQCSCHIAGEKLSAVTITLLRFHGQSMDSERTELEGNRRVVEATERQAIPLLFLVNLLQTQYYIGPRKNA